MKIIIAIDSFKGCLTSREAGEAAADGVKAVFPAAKADILTVSDGGDGMLDAFTSALGGTKTEVCVHDAMMRPVTACYGVSGDTAIVEVAQACGLTLVEPEVRNAVKATSYGVGEIVADAIGRGCRSLLVGLGGTATTDGGMGMLRALTDKLCPGGNFDDIKPRLSGLKVVLATDVENPLCGDDGSARVFGPQKGATADDVVLLDKRLKKFAEMSARHFGYDRSSEPGAGAAGGLGYAFMQYLAGHCSAGADLLFDLLHFDDLIKGADLLITGEGSADRQTLMGKLPFMAMTRARRAGVSTLLIAGKVSDRSSLFSAGFTDAVCINPEGITLEEAMKKEVAKRNIIQTVKGFLNS